MQSNRLQSGKIVIFYIEIVTGHLCASTSGKWYVWHGKGVKFSTFGTIILKDRTTFFSGREM